MADLEGMEFGGYQIEATLGVGAMGTVYRAQEIQTGRPVALKVLAPSLAQDPVYIARFRQEAIAAAQLIHPNIVQVFETGEVEGLYYIAMELVRGETLHDRLVREGPLPPDEAVAACDCVAEALQHAWNRTRLIHRDLKPGNVFISDEGVVKLGDFGLAKSVDSSGSGLTQTGTTMGTPHYMSPEQARGDKDTDFRSDIYSLGCTLYHLLTGKLPYDGPNAMAITLKHINDPPPAILKELPTCPMPLVMMLGKMLKKHPRERHQSYEELISEMRRVYSILTGGQAAAGLAVTPATARRAGSSAAVVTAPAAVPWWRSRAALAGAVVVIAAVGLYLRSPWKTEAPKRTESPSSAVAPAAATPAAEPPSPSVHPQPSTINPQPSSPTAPQAATAVVPEPQPAQAAPPAPAVAAEARPMDAAAPSAATTAAADGTVRMEWQSSGASPSYYRPQRLTLSAEPPQDVRKPPPDLRAPLYGLLSLGPRESPTSVAVIVDEPDDAAPRFFLDANANGDLTDDPLVSWSVRTFSSGSKSFNGEGDIAVRYGSKSLMLRVKFYRFDKNQRATLKDALFYYRDYGRAGEIVLGGTNYRACLLDELTSGDFRPDGRERSVGLLLDLNGNGRFESRERLDAAKPFNIGGTTYELAGMTASGNFTIAKSAQTVAETLPPPDLSAGKKAPGFVATTTDGRTVRFPDDYKGKLALLDFWATWCPPCAVESVNVAKAYARFHPQGLEILGISLDRENAESKLAAFTQDKQMPWPQVYDGKSWQGAVPRLYDVHAIPYMLLVKGDTGEILTTELRGELLSPAVEKALADSGVTASTTVAKTTLPATAPPATPAAPAAHDPWARAVNLLELVDAWRDRVSGSWIKVRGQLIADPNRAGLIEIPYEPADEYDFRIVFTPSGGNGAVLQYVTQAGQPFYWEMGAANNTLLRFEVNTAFAAANYGAVRLAPALAPGRSITSVLQVRRSLTTALWNGTPVSRLPASLRPAKLGFNTTVRDERLLALGTSGAGFAVQSLDLLEVGAPGRARTSAAVQRYQWKLDPGSRSEQVSQLHRKINELNPGYRTGFSYSYTSSNDTVFGLRFSSRGLKIIWPLRALTTLKRLEMTGEDGEGDLSDLSPLVSLDLRELNVSTNLISDLSPLRAMPNLTVLHCGKNRVQDFSPLAGLSLRELSCDFNPQRDAPVLRQIRSLQTVNGLPAGEFWKRQGLTP